MPSFQSFIYGNVPVEVDIDREGAIISIGVLKPEYVSHLYDILYWLDFDAVEAALFEKQFDAEIHACLRGENRISG